MLHVERNKIPWVLQDLFKRTFRAFDPEDHKVSSGVPHKGCLWCSESTSSPFSADKHQGWPGCWWALLPRLLEEMFHPKASSFQSCLICRAEVQASMAPAAPLSQPLQRGYSALECSPHPMFLFLLQFPSVFPMKWAALASPNTAARHP